MRPRQAQILPKPAPEVARLLSVSTANVGRLVAAGLLKERKPGGDRMGRKRYHRRDVEALSEKGWKWKDKPVPCQ
jgi:hypothetical protein